MLCINTGNSGRLVQSLSLLDLQPKIHKAALLFEFFIGRGRTDAKQSWAGISGEMGRADRDDVAYTPPGRERLALDEPQMARSLPHLHAMRP